ncbi:Emopamil-binding protein [Hysterangium stoloniferum]|nr:Emopamil-binding protein [Hysterangium stoloniferum]
MTVQTSEPPSIFTTTSLVSLTGVLAIYVLAHAGSKALLPKNASWTDRATFIWMTFDALIHFIFEGSFLYLSTFGRQVATSTGPFAELWMEYARADSKWAVADPTVVSLELLTVLGAGPMAVYIAYLLVKNDPARHYWIVVISTAELYGGFMTFAPSWLEGSANLNTSNWLYFWVYLVVSLLLFAELGFIKKTRFQFMNMIWVVIPFALLCDSYTAIVRSLRLAQAGSATKKRI